MWLWANDITTSWGRAPNVRAISRANFILVHQYGCPKKFPQKQKVKLLTLNSLFVKRKFNKIQRFQYKLPLQQKLWKVDFQFLTLSSTKLWNTLAPSSLDKLIQLISMEPYIFDLDKGKITDLDKFLKKLHSVILRWCSLTIHF